MKMPRTIIVQQNERTQITCYTIQRIQREQYPFFICILLKREREK